MKRHQYEDFASTPQNRVKGGTMQRRFPVRLKDGPFHSVDVKMTFEVPDGFEIEWVGTGYGDPKWNDGQGYFIIGLSVLRQSQEIEEDLPQPVPERPVIHCKRYLVTSGSYYYPSWGMGNFVGIFDTVDEAYQAAAPEHEDWIDVFDLLNQKTVAAWSWMRDKKSYISQEIAEDGGTG